MTKQPLSDNEKEERKNRRKTKLMNYKYKLKSVQALNKKQKSAFRSYFEGDHLLLHGSAGTGKTYIALYLALNDLFKGEAKQVLIIRSAVQGREVGHLPGSIEEKMANYEAPYIDIVDDLCQKRSAYSDLKKLDGVKFMSTSFIRGLTFTDTIVVLDEAQNLNKHELDSIMTRMGENSKLIVCGDFKQSDLDNNTRLKDKTGIRFLLKIAQKMRNFTLIEFTLQDVVRSGFVKEYLAWKEHLEE
jgi:phosphate starvation-inducible protein PhoH